MCSTHVIKCVCTLAMVCIFIITSVWINMAGLIYNGGDVALIGHVSRSGDAASFMVRNSCLNFLNMVID